MQLLIWKIVTHIDSYLHDSKLLSIIIYRLLQKRCLCLAEYQFLPKISEI